MKMPQRQPKAPMGEKHLKSEKRRENVREKAIKRQSTSLGEQSISVDVDNKAKVQQKLRPKDKTHPRG